VIAQVHGMAAAGGCHLVAACDLAVASPDARFAVPGPVIGLVGTTAMVEVARLVGRRRALQMLLSGVPISAETALAWGLVNAVVPTDELAAAAHAMARAASSGGPETGALAKRALYENLDLSLPDAYAHASEVTWQSLPGAEAQEGIAAFLDKRRAAWGAD
jgi:enoyl-CoA hydratase/carnithine racemase